MRVDFTNAGMEPPEPGKKNSAAQAGASGASNDANVDQTRFSFDQTRVQSLEAQVLAQPEIRQAKVQALQQAIGSGEYAVSAGQVAGAMISEESGTAA